MKRFAAIIVLIIHTVILASCAILTETIPTLTTAETTVQTENDKLFEETSMEITEGTTQSTESVVETTAIDAETTTAAIVIDETTTWNTATTYETLPEFESFMEFSGEGRGYFWGKVDITDSDLEGQTACRFKIIGVQNPDYYGKAIIYYAVVTETYGINAEKFNYNVIYCMAYKGTYENTLYGRPPLEVGKEYLRFTGKTGRIDQYAPNKNYENKPILDMSIMMPVEEIDGKTYVYGYGIDFGSLKCAIEITDEGENQIYKVGKHDKIIEKIKSYRSDDGEMLVKLPTFDYKCELEAMLAEVGILP